jgi:hypothetical protein
VTTNTINKEKTSKADSFRHMEIEIKIYYTLEDGHLGRNM